MRAHSLSLISIIFSLFLIGCSKEIEEMTAPMHTTLVTVTKPLRGSVEVLESSVGSLQSTQDPVLVAEISGKIQHIHVHTGDWIQKGQVLASLELKDLNLTEKAQRSEVKRLEIILSQHKRQTNRYRQLQKSQAVSLAMLDEAVSQEAALTQQLTAAKAQLSLTQHEVEKAKVIAPFEARVEKVITTEGSFVRQGEPLFQIVNPNLLQAYLPFPESTAHLLKPGLKVRLTTPTSPDEVIESTIKEIKPMTGSVNRALEVLVNIDNYKNWKPGSSVKGQVVIAQKSSALLVPEICVVLRPQGKVVYLINAENKAEQRLVKTGVQQAGYIEILSGLSGNEKLAQDGAGFLTDKAPIKIKPQQAAS